MPRSATIERLDRDVLKLASLLEATTLTILLFVAVPLKHLAGLPVATSIMGPVHGAAFLFYLWAVAQAAFGGGWRASEIARMIIVACLPLAGFLNQPWLNRKLLETQPEFARE